MKKFLNISKYIIFLTIGIFIFYYVYKGLGIEKIESELKNLKWGWVWLSFIFAILSHLSRALRWNMLIKPLGYSPRITNTFFAVMIMYASNLVITRSGEIARCSILSKYEKIPFGKLVGTVVTERATDTLLLLILVSASVLSQLGVFKQLIINNPDVSAKFNFMLSPWFWGLLILLGIIFILSIWKFKQKLRKIKFIDKLFCLLYDLFEGLKSIKNMNNPLLFIGHSLFIYIMYFLMLYVVFYSYTPTANTSILAALTTFIMGGLAMLAPVQGGIGAWHFMVIETLSIYNIDKVDGQIFALISHTSMNLMILVVGILCFICLPIINIAKQTKTI